jgi:PAS domain S-box-containing protein
VLSCTTDEVAKASVVSQCGFMLVDRGRGVLAPHGSYFHSDLAMSLKEIPLTSGITGKTIRTGVPTRIADVKSDPDYFEFDRRTRSELCLPVHAGGEVIGVMNLEDHRLDRFTHDDEQLLAVVIDFVSAAIERCRANEQLQASQSAQQRWLENLSAGVLILDSERICFANSAAVRILGAKSVEQLYELSRQQTESNLGCPLSAVDMDLVSQSNEKQNSIETQFIRLDGGTVDVALNLSRTEYAGKSCVQVCFFDVTSSKRTEAALRQSQQSLNSIAAATPHWIYIFDLDVMGITYANRSLLLDLGYPPGAEEAERSILSFADYLPPNELAHLASLPAEWRNMKDGQYREDEYRLNHIDGRVCYFACREVVYARRPDGSVKQILGTLTDITGQKQAENDLAQSERRFRDLADAIPQIVWIADAEGGLTDLNAQVSEYTGIGTENLTGWSWEKVIHPDDLKETVAVWNQCLSDGQPRDMAFRIRRADKTYRWHIARQVPVRDASGRITAWYGTCTDVEDLKRTEASLQESESRFRLLMEEAGDAIFWADAESGLLTSCNRAAEILLGRDRNEILGQPQSFLHPPEEVIRYQKLFRENVIQRSTTPVEVQVIRKDGTRVDVAISPSIAQVNGQRIVQGIFRDISARKKAEQTIKKLSDFREAIIRTAAEGICVCFPVPDFPFVNFTVWNDRMTEITGYTMEEINRLGWYQSLYPDLDIRMQAIQRMESMRSGKDLRGEEWRIACKDGGHRTISISTSRVEMEEGVSAVAALIQDITLQKQAVQSLQDSQRDLHLFRELVNWTNDTIHVMDPETSRFLDVNERACERLGYTREEILNLGVIDIEANLPDLASWQRHVQEVAAAGSMLLEGIHRRKDGSTYPVEINVRHVTVDHREYMVAVARDISERRHAEAVQLKALNELRTSEDRFSKLFHASPFSIIVASYPEGQIVEANEAFLRLFEFQREEVIGRTTGELNIWLIPDERQRMLDSLKSQRAARNMEYQFRTKSGHHLFLVMSVELIQIDGSDYSLAMSIDITGRKAAEADFRKASELLQAVVESTTDAVFVKDQDGKYLLFNAAASQFVGVPAAAVIGRDDSDLFDPESVNVIRRHDLEVMKTGIPGTSEELVTAAGVSRTYLATKVPYRDALGNIIGIIGISRDISDRKKSEQITRDNEQLLSLLMDSIPAFTAYVDSEERYQWVNKVHEQWFGRSRSEILGRTVGELLDAEAYATMRDYIHRALRGENVHYEQDIISPDQSRRTFDIYYVPHRKGDGHVLGFFALVFELTRERSAQIALRESEVRYRRLFETCGDAIFILDVQGVIRSANPAAARMHGYEVNELIGMSMRQLDVPADANLVPNRMKQLLSGERTLHFEVMHRHKDGTEFPLDVVATLLKTEDEPLILAFDRDITERKRTELALATSELKYRTLINATHAVTWSCLPCGKHIRPQKEWMEFTGQSEEQMLATEWMDVVHPDDAPAVQVRWQHSIDSGEAFTSEHRIKRKDNEWRWMSVHAVPFRDGHGRILEWIGISFDMTTQKRMEETLRHILEAIAPTSGEDYFCALVRHLSRVCQMDYALVGELEPDGATIRTLAVSYQGETIPNFSYSLADTPCEKLMNTECCLFPKNIQQLFPADLLLSSMGIESYVGVPLKSLNGRVTGLMVMLHSQELSDSQQAETLLRVVARHAAAELERGQSEAARQAAIHSLQDSETFLRMAQEAAHVGSWEWDIESHRFKWSTDFARTYVTSQQASTDASDSGLKFGDAESSRRFQMFLRALTDGNAVDGVECRIHRLDGSICDLWFVGQVHSVDNRRMKKVLGVAIDITDRKREEEHRRLLSSQLAQAQKMEAIGRLAGGVAHDFNNILTVINGYSKLLQELLPEDSDWSPMLYEISEAGARAASLTQQLLNYSRKQVVDRRVLDMNDVVRKMENMLRQLIGEDIQLIINYHDGKATVIADAGQIGQVIMNLVVNARDAMPKGGTLKITIRVRELSQELLQMHPESPPGRFVQLSVRDNGVGIPADLLDRIFEPFFTTKNAGIGTGLGLASVRSIAEDGQGFTCVDSEPGQGSDFQFYLPEIDVESPSPIRTAPEGSGGRGNILLVEDENAVRAVMRRFLEHFGYSVVDVASATEAVNVAEKASGAIDLLITDVVMPQTGGRELVEQIRTRWPEMRYLFVSGYSTDDVVRRGVLHSKVAFLQKPFSPDALANKVREILADTTRNNQIL